MERQLYTYTPSFSPKNPVTFERNEQLAKWLAINLGFKFQGEYKNRISDDALENAFFVPHEAIPPNEAEALAIVTRDKIFGAVCDPLFSKKHISLTGA